MLSPCVLGGLSLPDRFFEPVQLEREKLKELISADPELSVLLSDVDFNNATGRVFLTDSGVVVLIDFENGAAIKLLGENGAVSCRSDGRGSYEILVCNGSLTRYRLRIKPNFVYHCAKGGRCPRFPLYALAATFGILPQEICNLCDQ